MRSRGYKTGGKLFHRRFGFSLLEMAIAIAIVSGVLITALSSVISSYHFQIEADRLALAMSLVQTKMAELRSDPNLSQSEQSDEIIDTDSVYYGYKWETSVREEEIDIEKLLEDSLLGEIALGDQLPAGIKNKDSEKESNEGAKTELFSLSKLPILRITVNVKYPKGKGTYGNYRIETLLRSQSSKIYQRQ